MPGGDRTGPLGLGPMTGRGAGYCAGYALPEYAAPGLDRGLAARGWWYNRPRGAGRGFRCRNWAYATGVPAGQRFYPFAYRPSAAPAQPPVDREAEIGVLKVQAQELEQVLKQINERLTELAENKQA